MARFTLMGHQKEGREFIDSMDGIAALLWDPGTGKTGCTLSWLDLLASRQKEVRALVVSPLTASDAWVLQAPDFMDSPVKARVLAGSTTSILAKMAKARDWMGVPDMKIAVDHPGETAQQLAGQRVTILSMSAGAISSYSKDRARVVQMMKAIRAYAPHVIILDESHIAKAATSNISKAMYQLGQLAPHRIILTGTVAPLGPLDVFGQWRFFAPWTFSDDHGSPITSKPLEMTKTQRMKIRPWPWGRFRTRYTYPGGYQGKGIGGYQNLDDLHSRVAERSMVVKIDDVLDLPPEQDIRVNVTLSPAERKAYKQMHDDLAAELADGTLLEAPNALAKMMKLRQITSGYMKDSETGEIHVIGTSKQKAIAEVVNTTLAGEKRVPVFSYFKPECAALTDRLATAGTRVETITGLTKDRLPIRKRFGDVSGNPDRMVLVAQTRTMSVSVNELVTAQHSVFGSLSERREDWIQARGRTRRKGQEGDHCTYWIVIVPDTIDEIMLDRYEDKGDLEKALLDHIRRPWNG